MGRGPSSPAPCAHGCIINVMVLPTLIVIAAIYVLVNLAIDLLYIVIDPRVRY